MKREGGTSCWGFGGWLITCQKYRFVFVVPSCVCAAHRHRCRDGIVRAAKKCVCNKPCIEQLAPEKAYVDGYSNESKKPIVACHASGMCGVCLAANGPGADHPDSANASVRVDGSRWHNPICTDSAAVPGSTCAFSRGATGCTANDFIGTVQATSNTIQSCHIGDVVTGQSITFTLASGNATRYDVGLFIGETAIRT